MSNPSLATAGAGWSGAERRVAYEPSSWSDARTAASTAGLLLADAAALALATAIVVYGRYLLFNHHVPPHWGYWSSFIIWFSSRAWVGLYHPFGRFPPEELRRSFLTSTIALGAHLSVLLVITHAEAWRLTNALIWPLALVFTYAFRTAVRGALVRRGSYGQAIAVIGNGITARHAIRELQSHPELGLVPVAVFSTEYADVNDRRALLGVPVVGRADTAAHYKFPYTVCDAMIAVGDGWGDERNQAAAKSIAERFPHLQIFSPVLGHGHCLAKAHPLGPYLVIDTWHSRFTWSKKALKRVLDIVVSLPVLIVALPFLLIAALAIIIANPGSPLFSQEREGRKGTPIRIYKLRSMVVGAEAKLASYLATNQAARFEFERTMKLRNDPRIIPVIGKIIRKSSLDEIPQLWSVLIGDMSLVGPRVMPAREVGLYSRDGQELRRDVKPGLTGFWQVEHRSDSDFSIREIADSFYVANWSIWLDLWIILRTVRVVLTGSGAF